MKLNIKKKKKRKRNEKIKRNHKILKKIDKKKLYLIYKIN